MKVLLRLHNGKPRSGMVVSIVSEEIKIKIDNLISSRDYKELYIVCAQKGKIEQYIAPGMTIPKDVFIELTGNSYGIAESSIKKRHSIKKLVK